MSKLKIFSTIALAAIVIAAISVGVYFVTKSDSDESSDEQFSWTWEETSNLEEYWVVFGACCLDKRHVVPLYA